MKFIISALAVTICICANAQQVNEKDWARFNRYEQANDTIKIKPRAVFMGDSITDIWAEISHEFFSSNNLVGRGISGQTTSEMLVRFRRDVLDLEPRYVVIMAGTNDIAMNNGFISHENILGNIQSMCELARAHKIKPIICSVLPADRFKWRKDLKPANDIIRLNEMLREYAESVRIPYVDYHTALKNGNDGLPERYAPDGVHPNRECYNIMEDIILKYL